MTYSRSPAASRGVRLVQIALGGTPLAVTDDQHGRPRHLVVHFKPFRVAESPHHHDYGSLPVSRFDELVHLYAYGEWLSQVPLGSNRDPARDPGRGRDRQAGLRGVPVRAALERLPALFEGPGTSGHAPDKVDVDTMKKLRANGLRARKRRRR